MNEVSVCNASTRTYPHKQPIKLLTLYFSCMSGDRYYIRNQHEIYFLTFTVVEWIDVFTRPEYKMIIIDSLNYCIEHKGLTCYGWVLMTNHMHLLVKADEPARLSDIIRDFKKFTSKKIVSTIREINESRKEWLLDKFSFMARKTGRAENYKLWKDDNHAIMIIDEKMFDQKLNYIHQNPVRQMIVPQAENYLLSSAHDHSGGTQGLVRVTIL